MLEELNPEKETGVEVFGDSLRRVARLGKPGSDGAPTHYHVTTPDGSRVLACIKFQADSIVNMGVKGVSDAALLVIVEDRMKQRLLAGGDPDGAIDEAMLHIGTARQLLKRLGPGEK